MPAAAVIMHLWVWHPIIAIKTFVVGFFNCSCYPFDAWFLSGFRGNKLFTINIPPRFPSPGIDGGGLPWEKEYAKGGLIINAWIIQHGIHTTGLYRGETTVLSGAGVRSGRLLVAIRAVLVLVCMLVFHDQVMINRRGWGGVWMRGREVKFDDPAADKQKQKHSSITFSLIKNES